MTPNNHTKTPVNPQGWPNIGRFIGTTYDGNKDRWPWQNRRVYQDDLDRYNGCKHRIKVKLYEHTEPTKQVKQALQTIKKGHKEFNNDSNNKEASRC